MLAAMMLMIKLQMLRRSFAAIESFYSSINSVPVNDVVYTFDYWITHPNVTM